MEQSTTPQPTPQLIVKRVTQRRRLRGVVLSAKANKTLVIGVELTKRHPLYLKRYTRTRKFKVHDERNFFHEGDVVDFVECRPLSKEKRWRVLYKSSQAAGVGQSV